MTTSKKTKCFVAFCLDLARRVDRTRKGKIAYEITYKPNESMAAVVAEGAIFMHHPAIFAAFHGMDRGDVACDPARLFGRAVEKSVGGDAFVFADDRVHHHRDPACDCRRVSDRAMRA